MHNDLPHRKILRQSDKSFIQLCIHKLEVKRSKLASGTTLTLIYVIKLIYVSEELFAEKKSKIFSILVLLVAFVSRLKQKSITTFYVHCKKSNAYSGRGTAEPRYIKGTWHWQNLCAIKRFCYIELLYHVFYCYWSKENHSLYQGPCYKGFVIWRFYSICVDDRKDTKRGLFLHQIPPFVLEQIKSTSKGDFSSAYRHVVT